MWWKAGIGIHPGSQERDQFAITLHHSAALATAQLDRSTQQLRIGCSPQLQQKGCWHQVELLDRMCAVHIDSPDPIIRLVDLHDQDERLTLD